jgi:carbohydrate-selective porin OprB
VMLGNSASIQPNLQYVFNPMGQGKVDDALVLGLQMNITF